MRAELTNRQKQAIDTKNKIYNTALLLFKKYGFDKVTIKMIVTKSKVSTGSFYTYFRSKESIIIEFFSRIDSYYDKSLEAIEDGWTNEKIILNMLKYMTKFVEQQLGVEGISIVYYMQLYVLSKRSDLTNRDRSFFRHLTTYVKRGVENNEFVSSIPVDEIVDIIARLVHGLVFDWCLYNGKFNLTEKGQTWFKDSFLVFKTKTI